MTKPLTDEIPPGSIEYVEKVSTALLSTIKPMFDMAFGGENKIVLVAARVNEDGTDSFVVISDYDEKPEMVRVMREAARRAIDGSMIDPDDFKELKH